MESVNRYLNYVFSNEYPVKRIIKKRFDLPELLSDDIKDNERELKYILSLSNFAKHPAHLYQALRFEFIIGNKFDALLPHLMNFFRRYNPHNSSSIKLNKVELFFRPDVRYPFSQHTQQIFESEKCIRRLQEFFIANPDQFAKIKYHLNNV